MILILNFLILWVSKSCRRYVKMKKHYEKNDQRPQEYEAYKNEDTRNARYYANFTRRTRKPGFNIGGSTVHQPDISGAF
ncbi:hypothetical protein BZA77DRAFT_327810 [Pyronema omphalodes]|nr:hypothetical protein BZA77DRAFT_327810 [Pyronema omphalodes]